MDLENPSIKQQGGAVSSTVARGETQTKYKLSCTTCRSRKIKCDRVYPCIHCVKSGVECVFPERKRMQRPRKSKNSELLNRISRLESIVGKVGIEDLKALDVADIKRFDPVSPPTAPVASTPQTQQTQPVLPETSATMAVDSQTVQTPDIKGGIHPSRYMSSDFWSNLAEEVEGLKQALGQSTDSDSEEETESMSPGSATTRKTSTFSTQGLMSGDLSPESAGNFVHPQAAHVEYMITVFFENVDPILKILHRPSIRRMISAGTPALSAAQEALMFSMYFSAVTSLSPEKCLHNLGQDQRTLIRVFQLDVERALAAADYLNSNDMTCLQAMTLYVACLRVHNDTRASWALTALLIRLAQAFDLNRDGDGRRYGFFEAEMRRRLWWQIVVLDIRASEDRGTEAMIASDSYNTRLPHNLNDDDFGPDTVDAPPERNGPTEVTFFSCTAQSSGLFLWVGHGQAHLGDNAPRQSEEEIVAKARELEERFVAHADPTHYQSSLAAGLMRLIILKLWLIMQYPIHPPMSEPSSGPQQPGQPADPTAVTTTTTTTTTKAARPGYARVSREYILQTAVSAIELQEDKHRSSSPYGERFSWWGATYTQWHPLAVALAELCAQTRGPLVERAWRAVEVVFPKWGSTVADSRTGALWRPIRKLYKKAKRARALAVREEEQEEGQGQAGVEGDNGEAAQWRSKGQRGPEEAMARLEILATEDGRSGMARRTREDFGSASAAADADAMFSFASGRVPAVSPSGPVFDPLFANVGQMNLGAGPIAMPDTSMLSPPDIHNFSAVPWPDLNLDVSMMDNSFDPMHWNVWNEFLDDTYKDSGSRTGSSEDNFT